MVRICLVSLMYFRWHITNPSRVFHRIQHFITEILFNRDFFPGVLYFLKIIWQVVLFYYLTLCSKIVNYLLNGRDSPKTMAFNTLHIIIIMDKFNKLCHVAMYNGICQIKICKHNKYSSSGHD